jgi:hypothetical protein
MKAAAVFLCLATLACTDSSGPSENVDGVWVASGQSFSVTLELTQRGDSVTGSGASFAFVTSAASNFAIAGSYSRPRLALAFRQDTTVLAQFTATVATDGKSMNGVETFSGGADTLRFARQP